MANGKSLLSNPAVIGAVAASITWYLLDEVFDDVLENIFKKKKRNKGHKKVKMVKNKFGEITPYIEDDEYGSYFGAWERAYY